MAAAAWARPRGAFLPLAVLLLALAWVALWLWAASPYGRYLAHGSDWTRPGLPGALCAALPGGAPALRALLYAGGWVAMTAAMMLPTTLPLLAVFRRLTARRADRGWLLALVVAGFMAAWAGFGIAAHLLDAGLHALAAESDWVTLHGWAIGAGALAIAGAFQFSALKRRCLDRCRAPLAFVLGHWRGGAAWRQAWRIGLHHGAFCVGCCWALMLLAFLVGLGSLGWMLVLGAVMAAEKNLPGGGALSAPVGVVLLAWAAAILATHMGVALAAG